MSRSLIFFLLGMLLLGAACKKNNLIEVKGNVSEYYQQTAVPNAEVEYAFAELRNGVYSSGYTLLGSTTTDDGGSFSFSFQNVSAVNYRVRIRKDGFVFYEKVIQTDDWNIGSENRLDVTLFEQANLNFRFYNAVGESNKIIFSMGDHSENCEACCDFQSGLVIEGIKDTTFTCLAYANQNITYRATKVSDYGTNDGQGFLEVKGGENYFEFQY